MTDTPVLLLSHDSDQFVVIDEHYAQIRTDRERLADLRAQQASYRQAADKLVEAARLLEQECLPIEDRLGKTREFCASSLSNSPKSERAASALPTAMQLAAEAQPILQQLSVHANGSDRNVPLMPNRMGLQYVNGPATSSSPDQQYATSEHYTVGAGTPHSTIASMPRVPSLKRSHSMMADDAEDELQDDDEMLSISSSHSKMIMPLPSSDKPPPRKQGKFTDDDRHKIAAYLATTTTRAQNGGIDWKHFALTNNKYDATGWRTQYHSRKHKIEPLIERYRLVPQHASPAENVSPGSYASPPAPYGPPPPPPPPTTG